MHGKLIFSFFVVGVLSLKLWAAFQYKLLVWDSYVYLLNARVFIQGNSPYAYFELLRPPLLPFLVSLLWRISGEFVSVAATINPLFAVGSGLILYKWASEMFNRAVGFISAALLLVMPVYFLWTNQVLTHGIMIFFLMLAAYSLWKATAGKPLFYLVAGPAAALATLSRYTALLILPIAAVYLILVAIASRKTRNDLPKPGKRKFLVLGCILFLLAWLPWLSWNAFEAGNPFASVIAGSGFVSQAGVPSPTSGGSLGAWYYYLTGLSSVLTVPGMIVLALGLTSRKLYTDARFSLVLIWATTFLVFYSALPTKADRFYTDFLPPIAIIMGLGFDSMMSFLRRRRTIRVVLLSMTVIWLLALSTTAIDISSRNAKFIDDYFDRRGVLQVAQWLKTNMNDTDLGASNLGPYFSYLTGKNFLSIDHLLDESSSDGKPLSLLLSQLHVKYVVVPLDYSRISELNELGLRAVIGDFSVHTSKA